MFFKERGDSGWSSSYTASPGELIQGMNPLQKVVTYAIVSRARGPEKKDVMVQNWKRVFEPKSEKVQTQIVRKHDYSNHSAGKENVLWGAKWIERRKTAQE